MIGTLLSKVEVGGQLPALVISSKHNNLVGPWQFHCEDEEQNLDGKAASIDVVSKEDVFGLFAVPSNIGFQQFQKIIELAVDIAYYRDWIIHWHQIGLRFLVSGEVLKTEVTYLMMRM